MNLHFGHFTLFAAGDHAGERVATASRTIVEIVVKNPDQIGFAVLPRRWVVEHPMGRNWRLAKDFEATIDSADCARAVLYADSVILLSPYCKGCFLQGCRRVAIVQRSVQKFGRVTKSYEITSASDDRCPERQSRAAAGARLR